MNQRESFNTAADLYDEGRITYPSTVIDWIIKKSGISKDDIILEIGAGTGQATVKFAKKGFSVHCIEPGENLAAILDKKAKTQLLNIEVDVDTFENWIPKQSFNTSYILSATAFHWIDEKVKYRKCADILNDGGYLILLWNHPDTKEHAVEQAYDLLFKYAGKSKIKKPLSDTIIKQKEEIDNSGFFFLDDFLDYQWSDDEVLETKEKFIKGFFSQSSYLSLSTDKKSEITPLINKLFESLPSYIPGEIHTTVYLAKKK